DDEECFAIIDQIRLSLPNEIRQARMINSERDAIMDEARARADNITKLAEADAQERVRDHRVTQQAQAQASEITAQAERDAARIRHEADDYVYRSLAELDRQVDALAREVRAGLQALRGGFDADPFHGEQSEGFGRSSGGWDSGAPDSSLE